MKTNVGTPEYKSPVRAAPAAPLPPDGAGQNRGANGRKWQFTPPSHIQQVAALLGWIGHSWLAPAGSESYHEQRRAR